MPRQEFNSGTFPDLLSLPESSKESAIISPVLSFNLQFRLKGESKLRAKKITNSFTDLDNEHQYFKTFTSELGLNSLQTRANYDAKVEEIRGRLHVLDNESLFNELHKLNRLNKIGDRLLEQANDYIAIRVALDAEPSLKGKQIDDLTIDEWSMVEQYKSSSEVPPTEQPKDYYIVGF